VTRPHLPDIDRVGAIIRAVAATEILPRFRRLTSGEVREKTGPGDLVTIADEEGERALTRLLAPLMPGSAVVGEEAVAEDPSILDSLRGDAPVWILDPVDGTINFANGRPNFAVVVAYAVAGETLAGWIHDPCTGRLAVAVKGRGAQMDGEPLRVAPPATPVSAMVGALSMRFCTPVMAHRLEVLRREVHGIACLSCAAHEYLRLIEGRSHFSLYHRLMPWDHAAGVLLHAEAGGHAALLDGTAYGPRVEDGSLLMAPDRESWERLYGYMHD
jgi:fructose-1,6-bisphosphatase/inositol monophosphatase family enzyme